MIIRHVRMSNFMTHDTLDIQLPDVGVVLITGPNGAGKSAIIEACAHALFGKSVRGEWGWRDVPERASPKWRSEVSVDTDRVTTTRAKRKGSPSLVWQKWDSLAGGWAPADHKQGDTTSKAQADLERVLGKYDLWLRSHVFSSGDAAHFTLATDAKRKRFLEAMLGISYFDRALEITRGLLSATKIAIADQTSAVARADAHLTIIEAGITTATSMLAQPMPTIVVPEHPGDLVLPKEPTYPELGALPDLPDVPAALPPIEQIGDDPEIDALRRSLARAQLELAGLDDDLSDARTADRGHRRDLATVRAALASAQAELAKWPGGACPMCEQPVPGDRLSQLTARAKSAEVGALASAREIVTALQSTEEQIDEISQYRADLDAMIAELRDRIARHDARIHERVAARADLERRHAADVARAERQRAQLIANHDAAHRQRVAALRQQWDALCTATRREHAVRRDTYEMLAAEHARVAAEHAEGQARHRSDLDRLERERVAAESDRATARTELAARQRDKEDLDTLEDVFGLKGVRAHVLGDALSGLEALTNEWLRRVGKPGQTIRLREYYETDKGKQTPALSLELIHARRTVWHKYKASSQGERRRVDVALILALAEVGRAVQGRSRGTLFFDEVFDALDRRGVEQVIEVINELAIDRCVVVISHNPDLVTMLAPIMHVHIDGDANG